MRPCFQQYLSWFWELSAEVGATAGTTALNVGIAAAKTTAILPTF